MSGKYDAEVSNFMQKANERTTYLPNREHSKKLFLQKAHKKIRQNFFGIYVTN